MDFFMLEAGTSTVACLAVFALRIRVSISAMGSVICMDFDLLVKVTDSLFCLFKMPGYHRNVS